MDQTVMLDRATVLAHGGAPAGGAPLQDLVYAGIVGVILTAAVVAFGWAHRTGRTSALDRLAGASERFMGVAGFAALPALLVGVSLIVAVFGFYWDVSTHIDNGRDPGPFANPSHWFILVGLLGIALAGVLSLLLGTDDDHPTAVRVRGWNVPVGGVLLTICGVIALLGFPLDDVWHRIFGQDVTLWSPTHIQMVGGASLSTLAIWVLMIEGRRSPASREPRRLSRITDVLLAGAFLIGASTLQGEFDYAVPQFRLLYQPVLILFAAGVALVPARTRLGRGGAVAAALMFLALRGVLTLLITPVLGRTLFTFPLYLGCAIAVELVAWRVPTDRQITFGAWAGAAIGTLGLATEWLWSWVWMPIPWTSAMLPEAVLVGLPTAIAAGVVGGFIGRALAPRGQQRQEVGRSVAPVAGVALLTGLVYPMPMTTAPGATVTLELEEVQPEPQRAVHATVVLEPRDLAEDADYLNVTAWQGAEWRHGVQSFADPLERVEEGVYRTTRPIPVHGEWKALVRMNDDRVNIAAPIFMPEDEAIPAEKIPAEDGATREFTANREQLLREAKDVPGWLTIGAHAALLALIAGWIAAIGWGLRHLRRNTRTVEDATRITLPEAVRSRE